MVYLLRLLSKFTTMTVSSLFNHYDIATFIQYYLFYSISMEILLHFNKIMTSIFFGE